MLNNIGKHNITCHRDKFFSFAVPAQTEALTQQHFAFL
ncbi:hypothetical protein CZ794_10620 [Psychrobacter sp. JB385]|nr:hypothetical protein CZ794_10620 [Psychrobacter sp. JB385]